MHVYLFFLLKLHCPTTCSVIRQFTFKTQHHTDNGYSKPVLESLDHKSEEQTEEDDDEEEDGEERYFDR